LPGEYNEAADAYTVRQSDAHSWVEVYFPETNAWVTFDPTPPAGRGVAARSGVAAWLSKRAEALELIWFQYVVGYDQQEQRSLATSLHNRVFQYQNLVSRTLSDMTSGSWSTPQHLLSWALLLALLPLLIVMGLRMRRLGWRGLWSSKKRKSSALSTIEFYERLVRILAARGLDRTVDQTPLEFATETGMDVPLRITHAYHRVRYGSQALTSEEAREIDRWLTQMETTKSQQNLLDPK